MGDENIGKLMVTIGADIGDLVASFAKTAQHIKEVQKAVADVNFDQMVKNASVTARVIQSLRTQTVNGFADIVSSVKNAGKSIAETNTHLSLMGSNATNLSKTLNNLPFGKILDELIKIRQNTTGAASGFKTLGAAVESSGKAFRRQEFDLHRIILRLDDLRRKMGGFQKGAGVDSSGMKASIAHIKTLDSTYRKLGHSMASVGGIGVQSSNQMAKGFGILGMSLLSGSRIMRAFHHNFIDGLSLMSAEFWVLSMAARTAYRILMAFPTKAIQSVDAYRLSVIKTQALISTFSPKDIAFEESFKNARGYARELVAEMDILAAFTLGTSFDLQAITQEFMKQGVLVDINNAKAKDAFLNIANAIEIIASGFQAPELQIRQEARALAMGQVDLRATLATELNARLGGQLKERIALWKQEGTFIQHIGDLLKGYAASISDIRNTWKSVSALFKTMSDRVLRFGSEEFYTAINTQLRKMTDYLQTHENLIAGNIWKAWKTVLEIASSIKTAYEILQEPIQKLIELSRPFFQSWGAILVGFLPEAIERVALGLKGIIDMVNLIIKSNQYAMSGGGLMDKFLGYKSEETQKALKEIKDLYDSIRKNKAIGDPLTMGLGKNLSKDINARITQFNSDYFALINSLGKKDIKTPGIMPQVDREKFKSEYDSFLNATSIKTSLWLDEENRQIEEHRESLIRNKTLIIQDEAAIAKNILSLTPLVDVFDKSFEMPPFIRFESMGIQKWLKEYIEIIKKAGKETKEFTDEINALMKIKLLEKAEEQRKTIEAPSLAISQRYSSPMQKSMSELTEFIRKQKFEIEKLSMPGIDLLSPDKADKLLSNLDEKGISERRRIITESYQKIREEITKFDSFIAERTGGKSSLASRKADENKLLAKALEQLSSLYADGLIIEKTYIDKKEEMERASNGRALLITEEFNSEMLLKQLSLRKSQLDVAEIELTMSRGNVAKERLVLEQQELALEIKHLDTLTRIEGIGSLAWSEQRKKVEELRESIAKLGQTVRETSNSMGGGMKFAMEKYIRDSNSNFEFGMQFIEESASGMTSFIGSIFDDFRNRDLKSWSEYLINLVNVFAQAAQKIAAEMLIVKTFSFITKLFSTGANLADPTVTGAPGTGFPSPDMPISIPGTQRVSNENPDEQSRVIVHQAIHFNIKEPMDAYSFERYLDRSGHKIKGIVSEGVDQSATFKKQMRGK